MKLSTLLDWVEDFPFNGPLQSETWQAVGQRLFTTWRTIMAAIKGSHTNVSHYAASEADSPEPSAPPEPVHDPEIDPKPAELPYPEINPSPAELPYPDKKPCMAGPLSAEFPHREGAAGSLPAQNGDTVA